jgi:hypothetical protein
VFYRLAEDELNKIHEHATDDLFPVLIKRNFFSEKVTVHKKNRKLLFRYPLLQEKRSMYNYMAMNQTELQIRSI